MAGWIIWMIVAVLLGVAEAFTLTAALGLLGVAALITSGAAVLGLPLPLQLLVFAVAAAAGVVVVRPIAARHMRRPHSARFGVDALPGQIAYVLEEVTDRSGTVRIGGEEWTARPLVERLVIPRGDAVDVIRIDGATAVVYPRE